MVTVQEQPRKSGVLRKIFLVLRIISAAPGLLIAANRDYRQFAASFSQSAAKEGMPEELAREIIAEMKPLKLLRALNKGK